MSATTLRRLLIFLLLGIVTTIAVAWGCAWRYDVMRTISADRARRPAAHELLPDGRHWVTSVVEARGAMVVSSLVFDTQWDSGDVGRSTDRLPGDVPAWTGFAPDAQRPDRRAYATGWPLVALWCEFVALPQVAPLEEDRRAFWAGWSTNVRHGGVALVPAEVSGSVMGLALTWESPRALPLRPIPLNFAGNSLLFAAAWWAVLTLPRAGWRIIVTTRRRRRGACLACGYSHHGLPATTTRCPECGAQRDT